MTKPVKLDYHITAFSAVDNDELREIVKQGKQSIVAETLDKTLSCTYKVYGDNYVHVEFADNVISYVYDQYDGWSVRGVSREDSVGALKALYVKLGGDYDDVVGCVTDLEVLNKISVLYNGEDGARSYTEAIKNIADVIEPIYPAITKLTVIDNTQGDTPPIGGGDSSSKTAQNLNGTLILGGAPEYVIPYYDERSNEYVSAIFVTSASDAYDVTVNGESVAHTTTQAGKGYIKYVSNSTGAVPEIILTISDKQV